MFFGFLLIATGRQKFLIFTNFFAVSINFLGNLFCIPRFGFVGAAAVSVASEIFLFFIMLFFSRKFLKFIFPFSEMGKIFFAAFFAGIFAFFTKNISENWGNLFQIILVSGIFFGIFFGILWKFKILSPEILAKFKK